MENLAAQILLQVVFILLNAFFAGSEIAFLSLSQIKLSKQAEDGNKTAAALLKVVENPNTFLSGIQVAITLSGSCRPLSVPRTFPVIWISFA